MSNFWSKAMGVPAQPAPASTPTGPVQPWWSNEPAQPPQRPPQGYQQQQAPGGYDPRSLAVQPARGNPDDDRAGQLAAERGYISRPPDWVKKQATERCPECGGVNFARHGDSEGSYGKLRRTSAGAVEFGHCFDCGYAMNGGNPMSDAQIGNTHSHGALGKGGQVHATRQSHSLGSNFFEIKIK